MIGLAVGGIAFVAGLLAVFAGPELRGRLAGFVAMAVGAVVTLVAARPGDTATWVLAILLVPALAALIWLAGAVARPSEQERPPGRTLDDDPR